MELTMSYGTATAGLLWRLSTENSLKTETKAQRKKPSPTHGKLAEERGSGSTDQSQGWSRGIWTGDEADCVAVERHQGVLRRRDNEEKTG